MRLRPVAVALVAFLVGTVAVSAEAWANPPSWAPAYGWHKKKNIEKREQRAEKRESRALKLRDPAATTTDLNRSQITKLDRQNRQQELAEIRREKRAMQRQQALRP